MPRRAFWLLCAGALVACNVAFDVEGLSDEYRSVTVHGDAGVATGGAGSFPGCVPHSCATVSPACGDLDDGCGKLLRCGCAEPATCVQGQCVCGDEVSMQVRKPGFLDSKADSGDSAWASVNQAQNSENKYAEVSLDPAAMSQFLTATEFGFDIPDDATVTGVELLLERKRTALSGSGTINDHTIRLLKDGALSGTNKAADLDWPSAELTLSYGGESDAWGLTFSPADIDKSTFGVAVRVKNVATKAEMMAQVDSILLRVYFKPKCGPLSTPWPNL